MTDQERTDWAIAEAFTDVRREWEARPGHSGYSELATGNSMQFVRAVDARAAEYAKDAPRGDGHVHEWERGAHMAHAFGVDGRSYACAICGERKPLTADRGRDALAERLRGLNEGNEADEGFTDALVSAATFADWVLGERGVFLPDPTEAADFGLLDGLAAAVEALPLTVVALHGGPDRVDRAEVLRLIEKAWR